MKIKDLYLVFSAYFGLLEAFYPDFGFPENVAVSGYADVNPKKSWRLVLFNIPKTNTC